MRGAAALSSARARLRARIPDERPERVALGILGALLALGVALRLALMVAYRPAFVGFPDVGTYIDAARHNAFQDPLRPAGYPLFLRVVHAVTDHLSVTILLQHALGVATALLLYAAVRRAGFGRFPALVPAAVVLLGGSQIFLEHTPISETLFTFLLAAALYCTARLTYRAAIPWAIAAGLLAALAGSVRVVGFGIVPVLAVWMALAAGAGWRRRLVHALACVLAGALVYGVYVYANDQSTGYAGITKSSGWNLYGRAAVFADCSKFTPPKGTRRLCEKTPESKRPNVGAYVQTPDYSPAVRAFGGPLLSSAENADKVGSFARAAILGQPFDYLRVVGRAMLRYVDPGTSLDREGYNYTDFFHSALLDPNWGNKVRAFALPWYGPAARGTHVRQGLLNRLLDYEKATQLKGPLFVLLALLSLASPFVTRGPRRRAAVLFVLVAWASLILPVASLWWSARYAVPAFGPLAASAGVGAWGVVRLARGVVRRRTARSRAVPA